MAVYTEVSSSRASELLHELNLGELRDLRGCAGGIENTNYFVTAMRGGKTFEYVLTLFERLTFAQLPFYLRLMKHLAQRGIAVPEPSANAQGDLVFDVQGKPAAVVNRLRGKSELNPTPAHCALVGSNLARMHLAGTDFNLSQPNLRGLTWWNKTIPVVLPYLNRSQSDLIRSELDYQNRIALSSSYRSLPRGPIHADLFRDNVLFEEQTGPTSLGGFFDFYFAGVDHWIFDVAVCLNDWCVDLASGAHHTGRARSFLDAYQSVRPLTDAELELVPAMVRAGALRFWISRLWDHHLPREASILMAHDPDHFEAVLRQRVERTEPMLAGVH